MRSPAPLPLTLTPQWSCLLPLCLEALPTSRLAMRSQVRTDGAMGGRRVGRKTGDAGVWGLRMSNPVCICSLSQMYDSQALGSPKPSSYRVLSFQYGSTSFADRKCSQGNR